MLTKFPRLCLTFTAAACLLALLTARKAGAQSDITLATFYAIGLEHAENKPYNFTGRIFSFDDSGEGIASGTLIRRHTVLTAGHVVYDATTGFATNLSFTRGLYGNAFISTQQGGSVAVLAGYTSDATTTDVETIAGAQRDLGYLLIPEAPVDEDWGNYDPDPTQLTNNDGRFILGYPGVTFDGLTMAYLVVPDPFVQIGQGETGAFNNDQYIIEPGFSGGPVYAVVNGQQVIVAEVTSTNEDTTGEFNIEGVRAIDSEAAKFLQDAEYTAGLIKKVKITGPTVAARNTTLTYTTTVKFMVPNPDGTAATTDRYRELKLKSDTPGTATQPLTVIKKISDTQFQVTFSSSLRSGAVVNLFVDYDKAMEAPKSTLAVHLE